MTTSYRLQAQKELKAQKKLDREKEAIDLKAQQDAEAKKIKANEDRIAKKLDRIAKGLPVEDVKPKAKPKAKKKVVAKKSKKSKQMDEIVVLDKIKKAIETREDQIQETLMTGGLKDMEHYKYLQGELNALYFIANEISDLAKENNHT